MDRRPRPRTAAEIAFLALGDGAALWLTEAAAAGAARIRAKMDQAVQLAGLFGAAEVDAALGQAAVHGRFAETDLASILDHRATGPRPGTRSADEASSLTQGTSAWAALGNGQQPGPEDGHRPAGPEDGHQPAGLEDGQEQS